MRGALIYARAMIYRFGPFELDMGKVELRAGGEPCPVEPQVFALIAFLVENRERLVSRDELIERIWDGRVVSDAAVSSRVKSARQALGDSGREQRYIRTQHRRGFRFVAAVSAVGDAETTPPLSIVPSAEGLTATRGLSGAAAAFEQLARPSIAVLPFRLVGEPGHVPRSPTRCPTS